MVVKRVSCGGGRCHWAQVKVLWVINAVEKNWEKSLPEDVRDALNASRKKKGGIYATEEGKKDADQDEEDAKGELVGWLLDKQRV